MCEDLDILLERTKGLTNVLLVMNRSQYKYFVDKAKDVVKPDPYKVCKTMFFVYMIVPRI